MSTPEEIIRIVEEDIWKWIHEFVTAKNEFYDFKFPPCPYARQAVLQKTVDVRPWTSGDVRKFIRQNSIDMHDCPTLTTRVMAFPPRIRLQWGINDYVEELISTNVFLNPGVAKTTKSRFPGSNSGDPYFIVIANSLGAVLSGAEALAKTDYYKDWPAEHYAHVVERRVRMARQFGAPLE